MRGPSSEPVDHIDAARIALDGPGAPQAVPLIAAEQDQGRMPSALQLADALRSAAPEDVGVELVFATNGEQAATSATETGDAVAVVVRLALADYAPVLLNSDGATDGIAALTSAGASVVLGSPFVAEFSPLQPLGLLQIDGRVLSELQPYGYTRILGFRADRIGVVGRRAFHRGLFDSAMQVGPGIIEGGKLDISERELKLPAFFRTFLVNCGDNVLLGASTKPVHLRTLGEDLLNFAEQQALNCDEAVNLSGDREVLLAVRNGVQAVAFGNPRVKKTALIGFVPKGAR